ncbi:hypothetical protein DAPPUDRAFT_102226 [Daphnia pulex]|uniref:Uncharacterized protein n=1 Tax=Daphnia pulex TaxID=6669 RepID=E9GFS6_DAPPU|nr:hypothetical protein DAPPUDRAFT_102226 [Daphnia pulex]|eukprot:EFX81759.1 hypothetical protein DAPPUDRAFT_102226 [Daphnia pulex]
MAVEHAMTSGIIFASGFGYNRSISHSQPRNHTTLCDSVITTGVVPLIPLPGIWQQPTRTVQIVGIRSYLTIRSTASDNSIKRVASMKRQRVSIEKKKDSSNLEVDASWIMRATTLEEPSPQHQERDMRPSAAGGGGYYDRRVVVSFLESLHFYSSTASTTVTNRPGSSSQSNHDFQTKRRLGIGRWTSAGANASTAAVTQQTNPPKKSFRCHRVVRQSLPHS